MTSQHVFLNWQTHRLDFGSLMRTNMLLCLYAGQLDVEHMRCIYPTSVKGVWQLLSCEWGITGAKHIPLDTNTTLGRLCSCAHGNHVSNRRSAAFSQISGPGAANHCQSTHKDLKAKNRARVFLSDIFPCSGIQTRPWNQAELNTVIPSTSSDETWCACLKPDLVPLLLMEHGLRR